MSDSYQSDSMLDAISPILAEPYNRIQQNVVLKQNMRYFVKVNR